MSQRMAKRRATTRRKAAGSKPAGSRAAAAHRAKGARGRRKPAARRWSRAVTETSDALDLRAGVFTLDDPRKIAASLKRSAERSDRRKADPYRSAMSMLTFYINRGGDNLSAARKARLERAKGELRRLFGRA